MKENSKFSLKLYKKRRLKNILEKSRMKKCKVQSGTIEVVNLVVNFFLALRTAHITEATNNMSLSLVNIYVDT